MATRTRTTIAVASQYLSDYGDCLFQAAALVVEACPALEGWDLGARWDDDQARDAVLLALPAWAAAEVLSGLGRRGRAV